MPMDATLPRVGESAVPHAGLRPIEVKLGKVPSHSEVCICPSGDGRHTWRDAATNPHAGGARIGGTADHGGRRSRYPSESGIPPRAATALASASRFGPISPTFTPAFARKSVNRAL